jgi:chemotaxis protein methyltransferase CheR
MTQITSLKNAPSAEGAAFSHSDFVDISGFALKHFGLSLSESKIPLIASRLNKRLKALQLNDFAAYREILHSETEGAERAELLSTLTTNVTHFFRELHHFDHLRSDVLPKLIEHAKAGNRVRLWSAGCSTGQEPYSIALTLLEACPEAASYDVKILATDIDPVVVETAKRATYTEEELAPVSDALRQSYTTPQSGDTFQINADVRSLITFGTLNLIEPLPVSGPFDAIFCRNVAIYFDRPTQQAVWQTLTGVLGHNGHLYIGHSERMSGPAEARLSNVGITTYRRSS